MKLALNIKILIRKVVFVLVEAVSLVDVGNFLNMLVRGFQDYIYFAFVMMATFSIMVFIKYLLSGVR